MTISSMTGFARAEGQLDGLAWVWELKSVNGKSLDLRLRLPPGFDALELPLRASLTQALKRGAVSATLQVTRATGAAGMRVNREALASVLAAMREVAGEIDVEPPRLDGLLAIRGVLESSEETEDQAERERREAKLLESWEEALRKLAQMRLGEGVRLTSVLEARLKEISVLVSEAESSAATQPDALKVRL